jgi:peroxiredoxin Q/BCP
LIVLGCPFLLVHLIIFFDIYIRDFKDFLGKWLVLYFYLRDNTAGCSREFSALKEKLVKKNAVVVGVSKENVKSHMNFIEKKDISITLLSNEDTTFHQKYRVWRMKKNYGNSIWSL